MGRRRNPPLLCIAWYVYGICYYHFGTDRLAIVAGRPQKLIFFNIRLSRWEFRVIQGAGVLSNLLLLNGFKFFFGFLFRA